MKHVLLILLFISLRINGYSQSLWGEIRGEVKVLDSLQADYVYIIILQKGDTICYASIRSNENLQYKSCSLDTGTYDLVIDMRRFHFIKIKNIKVRQDAITFQDVYLEKELVQREGEERKIIQLPARPPVVKGCE